VTWKLRQDVKWADGETFTADDVLFTYQYITNPEVKSSSAPSYGEVKSVEALDDYTVRVNFKKPTAAWYAPFVGSFGMIIPRHIFEAYDGANSADAPANLHAIGTGPYFVDEYRKEDVLIIGGNASAQSRSSMMLTRTTAIRTSLSLSGWNCKAAAISTWPGRPAKKGWWTLPGNHVAREYTGGHRVGGKMLVLAPTSSFVERIMLNFTDPNSETTDGETIQRPVPASIPIGPASPSGNFHGH